MSTRNTTGLFEDTLMEIFGDNSEELRTCESQDSVTSLIRIFEDHTDIKIRLEAAQQLVLRVSKTSILVVENNILKYLMPGIKNLPISIYKEICQVLPEENTNEKSAETFNILQEHLQRSISVLQILTQLLEHILKNEEFRLSYIQSIPLNVAELLLATFQHCKDSNKLYKGYVDDLKEILKLFTVAQGIHSKLLIIMKNHILVTNLLEDEIVLLKNVLDMLNQIGQTLVDTNTQTLADNWKSYIFISQKFIDVLNQQSFDPSPAIRFLSSETHRKLNLLLKMTSATDIEIEKCLKSCYFFTRIIFALSELFSTNFEMISPALLEFLTTIYSYYEPLLVYRECPDMLRKLIRERVFCWISSFVEKLMYRIEFVQALPHIKTFKNFQDSLFFFAAIFQMFVGGISSGQQLSETYPIHDVFGVFFAVAAENYTEFYWKIDICLSKHEKRSIFNENLINISLIILSLSQKQYNKVETVLLKNIFEQRIWVPLLATDIWTNVLKFKHPNVSYETVCNIVTKTEPLLIDNFTNRPETVFLKNLIAKIYTQLTGEYKLKIINRYPVNENIHIWKVFGFNNYPESQTDIFPLLFNNITENITLFNTGKADLKTFNLLCNSFDAISSVETDNLDVDKFLTSLVILWDFQIHPYYENLLYFNLFIRKLLNVTTFYILQFNNKQLLTILTKLRQVINEPTADIKILTCEMLNKLAGKSFAETNERNQIMLVIPELLDILLSDKNPIIKQNAISTLLNYFNCTPHQEIIKNAVSKNKKYQKIMAICIQRINANNGTLTTEEYLEIQKRYIFQHICPKYDVDNGDNTDPIKKKLKMNTEEYDLSISTITVEIEKLHKISGKEMYFKRNVSTIIDFINEILNRN